MCASRLRVVIVALAQVVVEDLEVALRHVHAPVAHGWSCCGAVVGVPVTPDVERHAGEFVARQRAPRFDIAADGSEVERCDRPGLSILAEPPTER